MAVSERCYLGCRSCGRTCNGAALGRVTHRFDCCGDVVAHVPEVDSMWVRRTRAAGYLVGLPSSSPPDTPGALSPSGRDPMMVPSTPDSPGASTQRSHP